MKSPKVIYLQVCGDCQDNDCEKCNFDNLSEVTWCKDRINDNDVAYFSEETIREMLREEYKMANNFIRLASRVRTPINGDIIEIDNSIESAIKKLKGVKK